MGDGDEVLGLRDLDDIRQILVVDQAVVQVIDVKIALEGGGIEALTIGPNVVTPLRVAAIAKRLRLPVGVDLAVHNFQRIPRGSYALLHVVFLFVDRAVRICGEVEDHSITLFGLSPTGNAHVRQFNPIQIARRLRVGDEVVHQGDAERRVGQAQAVVNLAYHEVVPHHEGLFHGAGGDVVGLEGGHSN